MNRRKALRALAGIVAGTRLSGALTALRTIGRPLEEPFQPTQPTHESLAKYEIPQCFRDAKFGIWAHW